MIIALSIYVIIGVLFSLWFVAFGHRLLDASSADARLTVRVLWLPAALLLWPLLLLKTMGRDKS